MPTYQEKFDALKSATQKEHTDAGIRYKFPCGDFEYEQQQQSYYDIKKETWKWRTIHRSEDELVNAHLNCRVCLILLGLSKREKGFTQREVAKLFELGIGGLETGTGNYYSRNSRIAHYGTLTAVRTINKMIIVNSQDWARGFAHVTYPRHEYTLPLTIIDDSFSHDLESIEVIEYEDRTTLFTMLDRSGERIYLLCGWDEGIQYIAELMEPCDTIKGAVESMKPESVKTALKNGIKVYRQGELFFIATDLKDGAISDIEKTGIITYGYDDQQTGKHIVYSRRLYLPSIQINEDGTDRTTNHRATRVGKWLSQVTVVKGTVRHDEHRMLTLGDKTKWYLVVRNRVKRAMSITGRGGVRD